MPDQTLPNRPDTPGVVLDLALVLAEQVTDHRDAIRRSFDDRLGLVALAELIGDVIAENDDLAAERLAVLHRIVTDRAGQ